MKLKAAEAEAGDDGHAETDGQAGDETQAAEDAGAAAPADATKLGTAPKSAAKREKVPTTLPMAPLREQQKFMNDMVGCLKTAMTTAVE